MKIKLLSLIAVAAAALASNATAEVSTKLSNVHLCCTSCVKGAEKAAAKAAGATVTVDQNASTVTVSASSKAGIQSAVDALVAAGYYGKPSDAAVKVAANTGATDGKVASLKLEGVHLCCGKCVTAVQKALGKVAGVKGNTAEKNAKVFEVTGDFSPKAVFEALHDVGLTGLAAGIRSSMGHVSRRDPNDPNRFVVKGRGYAIDTLNRMCPENMVVCDLDGRLLEGPPGVVQCNEVMIHADRKSTRLNSSHT